MAKILVADDSWLIRQMVGKVLKANGHEVEEVVNGREALERATAEPPDCILLDLLMPELSGFEVLEGLRQQKLAVPVVVLSADIQDTSRNRCLELGASQFLNKPFDEEKVLQAINQAICEKGAS